MANSTTLSLIKSTLDKLIKKEIANTRYVGESKGNLTVGEFNIVLAEHRWSVQQHGRWIKTFDNKIVAYHYAMNFPIPTHKIKYIENIDRLLASTKQDKIFHQSKIRYYRRQQQHDLVELHLNRMSECNARISQCLNSISKGCKYNF